MCLVTLEIRVCEVKEEKMERQEKRVTVEKLESQALLAYRAQLEWLETMD